MLHDVVSEQGLDGQKTNPLPSLKVPTEAEREEIERRDREIAEIAAYLAGPIEAIDAEQPAWESAEIARLGPPVEWAALVPAGFMSRNGATLTALPDHSLLASGANPAVSEQQDDQSARDGQPGQK